MRHVYTLTDQTRKVLTGIVKEVADEMNVSEGYLYGMLSEHQTDTFAPFYLLYRSVVRAGGDTSPWDNRLAALHPQAGEVFDLSEKIRTDAETSAAYVDACDDGDISTREAMAILASIRREERELDKLKARMLRVLGGQDEVLRKVS